MPATGWAIIALLFMNSRIERDDDEQEAQEESAVAPQSPARDRSLRSPPKLRRRKGGNEIGGNGRTQKRAQSSSRSGQERNVWLSGGGGIETL